MRTGQWVSLALVGFMASWAQAQTSTTSATTSTTPATQGVSSAPLSEVKPEEKNKNDVQDQITNPKLAAEAGSKSKWSINASLSYSGGSVEYPAERTRPNYRRIPGAGADLDTTFGGSIAMAYRMAPKLTGRAGFGIRVRNPLHNNIDEVGNNVQEDSRRKIFEASSPYLELSSPNRLGKWMLLNSAGVSYTTNQVLRNAPWNNDFSVSLGATLIREIEGSRWQPGVSFSSGYSFYSDSARATDTRTNVRGRDDYTVGAFPFVEYIFNDTYQFRTLVGFQAAHYRNDAADTFLPLTVYQSMGLGIVPAKGIYLYPNVQWIPEDIRADRTNVAISATINVF